MSASYRGRFAPSPTGPLHFGSLVTGLASYLDARARDGGWLVRIEDLDPLRESEEAVTLILRSLEAHGLQGDEPVRFQSERHDAYEATVDKLLACHKAYRCICSRKELNEHDGQHPHHCLEYRHSPEHPHAIRLRLESRLESWTDRLLGAQNLKVCAELDDPVIKRKEGFYAYQLAVVVDDIDQGVTDIVRGSDLLETTPAQLQLYRLLGSEAPSYLHIPVIINTEGQKLSKQTHAPPLIDDQAGANLCRALEALGQQPPRYLSQESPERILAWGRDHWQPSQIPLTSAAMPDYA
ncbi:tRNA glutamyl-Q(34) synthetase GluQRS [Marinobacter nanhaiticus D15-8W]|uniref:Glutamyl-Q tRNA(Asp) synthetase n=1 Tax=Marinobacter nanhaiticus D15-8W TaxID=626887 RepID=N6WU34_9GAMM|nr:tRNA glutamyl-Q(34) synthetase GluQRS [Marinobacter nanhaiticus]ENO14557.2 tRNA glutamyl-Q(34) synthetase GluQRS [Marinobacter nanhaiticus D15-8W]BES69803.1 tRNA glutamyl-Q(34) synthetase GluQRS [Marinobacter nanhaiticus D15-8W]